MKNSKFDILAMTFEVATMICEATNGFLEGFLCTIHMEDGCICTGLGLTRAEARVKAEKTYLR